MISNLLFIIKESKNTEELREIVLSYPIIEFLRWKEKNFLLSLVLTFFQIMFDLTPAICYILFANSYSKSHNAINLFISIVLVLLGIWSYSTLRDKVYKKLVGKIETSD